MSVHQGTQEAYVGLGANLEDPARQVRQALRELDDIPGTRVTARSSLYRTAPVGYLDQPDFINAVAKLQTALSPRELLDALHGIESGHGRRRSVRNAPRTLDLDLLLYGQTVMQDEDLTLPHPRMHERAFVLLPLAELAPDGVVPGRGVVSQLLAEVDRGGVGKLDDA
jgi:2-amino-4-hydroxy-6-hydroxymethyldihydropteridine diphosphokinase